MSYTGRDFTPIHPGESEVFDFDFVNELDTDETLNSATWSIEVVTGTDASVATRAIGPTSILGTRVFQRLSGCLANVLYRLEATAVTSSGNTRTLFSRVRCIDPY